jgi:hypothetical protein
MVILFEDVIILWQIKLQRSMNYCIMLNRKFYFCLMHMLVEFQFECGMVEFEFKRENKNKRRTETQNKRKGERSPGTPFPHPFGAAAPPCACFPHLCPMGPPCRRRLAPPMPTRCLPPSLAARPALLALAARLLAPTH